MPRVKAPASFRHSGTITAVLAIFGLFCGSGCYDVIPQNARAQGGAWTMNLLAVRVGPNAYPLPGGIVYKAGAGNTMYWFYLRVTNSSAQDRRLGWKRCTLSHNEDVYVAGLVTPNSNVNGVLDDVEIIRAGQSVERRIGIAYPNGVEPAELTCGKVTLPLRLD